MKEPWNDSYLELIIPWSVSDGSVSYQAKNYYYRIPITGSDDMVELLRNHYYKVNVNVEVLGSLNPEEPVELDPDFLIMDWYSAEISADMQNYRYLVLNEYESYVYNNDELLMPYVSSSEIDESKTKITKVEYWDYHQNESYKVTLTENYKQDSKNGNSTVNFDDFSVKDAGDNKLLFSHVLTDDDFVEFVITVQTYNKQGVEADTWTIHQFPAIYIVGEKNDNGSRNRFVNGSTNTDELGGTYGLDNSTNANPNQYTLYITSFDINDKYAIGDPREGDFYDFGNSNPKSYRATRKESSVQDVISPIFKIASSWGQTSTIRYNTAVKRCATYQENGYPAGRWRVPTKAEVEFIISLSNDKKIPKLFNTGGTYWVSSGYYKEGSGYTENTDNSHYVRCVYDVWYWGDKKINEVSQKYDNYDFVWGDKGDEFYQ